MLYIHIARDFYIYYLLLPENGDNSLTENSCNSDSPLKRERLD